MGAEDAAPLADAAAAAVAAAAGTAMTAPQDAIANMAPSDMAAAAEAAAAAILEAGGVEAANPLLDVALMPGLPLLEGFPTLGSEEDQGFAAAYAQASREQYPEAYSVYVGNLDGQDEIWPEQLHEHFRLCGEVKRITIKIDKVTGDRMGFAYVDFGDATSAETALSLDGSDFRGRQIKVNKKRAYQPRDDWGKGGGKGGKYGGGGGYGKGYGKGGGGGYGKGGWGGGGWNDMGGGYGGGYGKSYGKGWGKGKSWSPY